jgi:polynucleotide 5'-kinase involved in rRNA processing
VDDEPKSRLPSEADTEAAIDHLEERVVEVENRLSTVEQTASRIPSLEARVLRHERLLLEVQALTRRTERVISLHVAKEDQDHLTLMGRLDDIRALILGEPRHVPVHVFQDGAPHEKKGPK